MPLNRYVVRVDPQGQTVTVDILDTSGTSVVVYDSPQFAASSRTLPLVITSQTDFWLSTAGPYDVSCKVGGAEVADAGAPKRVQVSDVPVLVVPDWERERTASSGGSVAVPDFTLGYTPGFGLDITDPITLTHGGIVGVVWDEAFILDPITPRQYTAVDTAYMAWDPVTPQNLTVKQAGWYQVLLGWQLTLDATEVIHLGLDSVSGPGGRAFNWDTEIPVGGGHTHYTGDQPIQFFSAGDVCALNFHLGPNTADVGLDFAQLILVPQFTLAP